MMTKRQDVEEAAMQYVLEHEHKAGCIAEDVSEENVGWDITSTNKKTGNVKYIEVKGHSGRQVTIMSPNEWEAARKYHDRYHLYVVFYALTRQELHIKPDPHNKTNPQIRPHYYIKSQDIEGS